MKLKDYIKQLEEFVKENPEALEYDTFTATDDEGNGYNEVYYSPCIGNMDDGEFCSKDNYDEDPDDYEEPFVANAVILA